MLSKLPKRERELLDVKVVEAADAVETIVTEGLDAAMRNFHAPLDRFRIPPICLLQTPRRFI